MAKNTQRNVELLEVGVELATVFALLDIQEDIFGDVYSEHDFSRFIEESEKQTATIAAVKRHFDRLVTLVVLPRNASFFAGAKSNCSGGGTT